MTSVFIRTIIKSLASKNIYINLCEDANNNNGSNIFNIIMESFAFFFDAFFALKINQQ